MDDQSWREQTMRKDWTYILTAVCALFMACGCQMRELTYDYHPFCDVRLNVDWSSLDETPSGMTAIFFNENGSEPAVFTTNDVNSAVVPLRTGVYNVILFNQSPEEFGSLGFRGLAGYGTTEIHVIEDTEEGWYSKAVSHTVAYQPEPLAVAKLEGFEVTEEMVDESRLPGTKAGEDTDTGSQEAKIDMAPADVITKGSISVRVENIYNFRSARAWISGMAESYVPSRHATGKGKVTHLLEEWSSIKDDADKTKGVLVSGFTTLGLPEMPLDEIDAEKIWEDATLHLEVLLVDNRTIESYDFNIAEKIRISDETGKIVLEIDITGKDDGSPIILKDVKPEGSPDSGFDVDVDDWGDEVDVNVSV